jgi:hypothetical protein
MKWILLFSMTIGLFAACRQDESKKQDKQDKEVITVDEMNSLEKCLYQYEKLDNSSPIIDDNGIEISESYINCNIVGFSVNWSRLAFTDREQFETVFTLIESDLAKVTRILHDDILNSLRIVNIWMEENRENTGGYFHPNRAYLASNNINTDKYMGIEFVNLKNFISWRSSQPDMVIHELAHAYHFHFLGSENPEIKSAYLNAIQQNLYSEVAYVLGGQRKAYALTNHIEYFAEITEAYLGKNDYFPFGRQDLLEYDYEGFQVVKDIWTFPTKSKAL